MAAERCWQRPLRRRPLQTYTLPCKVQHMPKGWDAGQIAALRAALGISQAEFARALGVRQQTVSEWETGRYAPRGASAKMLGVLAESRAPYDPAPPEGK